MQPVRRLALVLGVAAILLAGCGDKGSGATKPPSFDVLGVLDLTSYDGINYANRGSKGEECWGEHGFDDIVKGAQVVIKSPSGESIGLGELGTGRLTSNANSFRVNARCRFDFHIFDVPDKGDGVYSVEVSHRGGVSFQKVDASHLRLTIG